jgi:small subunit ribosomal protein S9
MEPTKAASKAPSKKPKKVAPVKKPVSSHGVGRRKASVARVWLRRGAGKLIINGKDHESYFDTELTRRTAITPFVIVPRATIFDAEVNVVGGGLCAQADAVKLAISRAFLSADPELKPLLRQHGLITVDSRVKERKKYGQKAARRRFQFVKR